MRGVFLPRTTVGTLKVAGWLTAACGLALCFDLGAELAAALAHPAQVSALVWAHLGLETAASLGLGWAFALTRREARRAEAGWRQTAASLAALRGAFDRVMAERFAAWRLTPAERDVALLVIRGLSIAEIAALRQTRPGTIKAQVHAVLAKSGASGRADLVARFLDELLDLGAQPPG